MINYNFNIKYQLKHHNHFTALFLGPPGCASARRGLLDFMAQGKINRGRHRPAGWAPLHPDLTSAHLHHLHN